MCLNSYAIIGITASDQEIKVYGTLDSSSSISDVENDYTPLPEKETIIVEGNLPKTNEIADEIYMIGLLLLTIVNWILLIRKIKKLKSENNFLI